MHLTEQWRRAVNTGMTVVVAFIDFRKAFDSVSHDDLLSKLQNKFGISGSFLNWPTSYLQGRHQYTNVNGAISEKLPVTYGIPQGSVLGPTLFTLFTNDLPSSVKSGSVYMYADDTTVFSIGADTDSAIWQLNEALKELYSWCLKNRLTPHPCKSEAMLLTRTNHIGPIAPIHIGASVIEWVNKTRLLGMTVDHKISWVPHILELKRNFAKKLDLMKRSRFLPRDVLEQFYFKVILPSVSYGLVMWGGCNNVENFNALERLHYRATKIIFNLPRDTTPMEVLTHTKWPSLFNTYKYKQFTFMHSAYHAHLPEILGASVVNRRVRRYSFRSSHSLQVQRFNTSTMRQSFSHRGAILWNIITTKDPTTINVQRAGIKKKLNLPDTFNEFNFSTTSVSTTTFRNKDFIDFID